jgi:uncharacterized membrane protein
MSLNTIFGLPAHALFVHVAVVFVPLASVGLILAGLRADWRRTYALPATVLAVIGAIAAFIAQQSGGPLRRAIRTAARTAGQQADFKGHPGQGNLAFLLAMLLGLAAVIFWWVGRSDRRYRTRMYFASYIAVVVVATAATASMIIAGHSGATLVWHDLGTYASTR